MTAGRLTALQLAQLSADLNPGRVAHRKSNGGGPQLSYLAAWDVRTALIRIFGYGGFSYTSKTEILSWEPDAPRTKGGTQFRVTAMSTVRLVIPVLDAVYEESAVSSQAQPDPGECADFAVKTAESDALKRAAVNLGTQFGLSLYNAGSTMDVVKVVREPYQAAILKQLAQGKKASEIDAAQVDLAEPADEGRTYDYDPDHGAEDPGAEGSQVRGPAPGESPAEDAPMALIPPNAEQRAAASDMVKQGFSRQRPPA